MNPKIEETVKDLRGCALGDELLCDTCVATGKMVCGCSAELMLIAADRLEALDTELAALKEQQRWFPVTERLPEDEKSVLVCTEHELRGKRYRLVAKAFYESGKLSTEESQYCWQEAALGEYDEESDGYKILEGWWEDVDYTEEFGPIDRPVTHWMQLPEAPKEDSRDDNN